MSAAAGVRWSATVGDPVEEGQALLVLYADDARPFAPVLAALDGAFTIGPEPPEPRDPVLDRIR